MDALTFASKKKTEIIMGAVELDIQDTRSLK